MKKAFFAILLVIALLATVAAAAPQGKAKDIYIDMCTRAGAKLDAYPIWFGENYYSVAGDESEDTGYKTKTKDDIIFFFEGERVVGFAIEEELKHASLFDERYRAMGWRIYDSSVGTIYCYSGSVKRRNKWTDKIITWHQDEKRFYGTESFASKMGVTKK